jgi:hypothetical protein
MKINGIILLLTMFFISLGAHAMANAEVQTVVVESSQNKVLSKKNLDAIKQFILKTGQTCTYSNMYNNNPCYQTAHYQFYLNPDPGGPHNHPQWNINCDPKKGDFNTLVIKASPSQNLAQIDSKIDLKKISTTVNFFDKENINIQLFDFFKNIPSTAAIASSEIAVKELLLAMEKQSKINKTPAQNDKNKLQK